jgi:hypothetical protein
VSTHSSSPVVPLSSGALFRECPHCEDGIKYTSRNGGNDPDVWSTGACETCDGTGTLPLKCEGFRCDADAVGTFDDANWCPKCLAEQRADAIADAFISIKTLMDWLREHVKAPPADMLYQAADATDRLRAMVRVP